MAAPNIVSATSLYGKTVFVAVGTSATSVVSNAAGSNKLLKIVSLRAANVDGTSNADVTVKVYSAAALGGTGYAIASTIPVPADAALIVVSKDDPIYLEENMSIGALAGTSGDIEIVCSYEEYDDA